MTSFLQAVRAAALLTLIAVLTGCASSYKPVAFDSLDYTGMQSAGALDIAYRYEAQPGYYGEKARKRGYDVIAVRVTNTLDEPVTLNASTLRIQAAGAPVSPLPPEVVADNIEQPVWSYLLWNLANLTIYDGEGEFVAFIPVGLGISIINMVRSSSANSRVEETFEEQALMGRTIAPGATVDGLLFLSTTGFAPLTFEYVGEPAVRAAPAELETAG
jgi:hypothetical protein